MQRRSTLSGLCTISWRMWPMSLPQPKHCSMRFLSRWLAW
jgi:hypothetical protein